MTTNIFILIAVLFILYIILRTRTKTKKKIGFVLNITDKEIYQNCKKFGYVNFYFAETANKIIVYAPNFISGDGKMAEIHPDIKHLYNTIIKNKINSATIVKIIESECVVEV